MPRMRPRKRYFKSPKRSAVGSNYHPRSLRLILHDRSPAQDRPHFCHYTVTTWTVDGKIWSGIANITSSKGLIAKIRKVSDITAEELSSGHNFVSGEDPSFADVKFAITIASGIDVALVCAICIALDGMRTEKATGWYEYE
jgi:hypothetical protein